MEELKQRIEMLQECGFVDEIGKADLYRIVEILQKHGIDTNDDNTSVLVTHVAAALKRSADGEIVTPLELDVLAQVKEIENYDKAVEIQQEMRQILPSHMDCYWPLELVLCSIFCHY